MRDEQVRSFRGRVSIDRVGWMLLALAVVIALGAGWVFDVILWSEISDEGSFVYNVATTLITLLLLALTIAAAASIRFRRLRSALLPIELGLIVGACIVASDSRGSEVDTFDDVIGIAIMFGIATAIVLGFVAAILEGHRYRGRWMVGVAAAIVVLGMATPLVLDRLDSSTAYLDAAQAAQMPNYELMQRFTEDNAVSLGSMSISTNATTYQTAPVGMATTAPYPEPVRPAAVGGGARVVVLADDTLEVRLRPTVPAGTTAVAELRTGHCGTPSDTVLGHWTVRAGVLERLPVTGITVRDLAPERGLQLRWGSGTPLGDVACFDAADPTAVLLAREGAARFGSECLAPLHLTAAVRGQITADSLQDAACAKRMRSLAELAGGAAYASRETASAVSTCVNGAGAGGDVRPLDGTKAWLVVFDFTRGLEGDPWQCLGAAGAAPLGGSASGFASPAAGYAVSPVGYSSIGSVDPATGMTYDAYGNPSASAGVEIGGEPTPMDTAR
jgi:hypothetical protein